MKLHFRKWRDIWATTGRVAVMVPLCEVDAPAQEQISSSQYVRFPFTPKTFYVDVVRIPILEHQAEQRGIHFTKDLDGECYYNVVRDPSQLDEVFAYYVKNRYGSVEDGDF